MDGGTLFQLRNLLKRRSVTAKIRSDPTACEEFFLLVVEAHILCAAMKEFGLLSVDVTPNNDQFNSKNFVDQSQEKRQEVFLMAVRKVIDKFVYCIEPEKCIKETDHVYAYAKEVLSLGLLFIEFADAIREGDGLWILRCWRYMLFLFKASNKTKYSVQAFTMLSQYHFLFSKRLSHQLLWSRTINVHGRPGKNVPMDLHMEHLNRELKAAISHLGANVMETTIQRVGLCKLIDIKTHYDTCSGIAHETGHHSSASTSKDLELIIKQLNDSNSFTESMHRKHTQFPQFTENIASKLAKKELYSWMTSQVRKLIT